MSRNIFSRQQQSDDDIYKSLYLQVSTFWVELPQCYSNLKTIPSQDEKFEEKLPVSFGIRGDFEYHKGDWKNDSSHYRICFNKILESIKNYKV